MPDTGRDIVTIVVFERHHGTGNIRIGFLIGFGLKDEVDTHEVRAWI